MKKQTFLLKCLTGFDDNGAFLPFNMSSLPNEILWSGIKQGSVITSHLKPSFKAFCVSQKGKMASLYLATH